MPYRCAAEQEVVGFALAREPRLRRSRFRLDAIICAQAS